MVIVAKNSHFDIGSNYYDCNHIFFIMANVFDLFVFRELEVSNNGYFQKKVKHFVLTLVTDQNGKACTKYIMIFLLI